MIPFFQSITIFTWLFIATLIISLVVYLFKLDKKVIFYYAKRNKAWAIRDVYRLQEELEQRKLKDKSKRLDKYIQRARELSKACNGRRFYVLPVQDEFVIVDSAKGKQWLKDNNFNSQVTLSSVCVYYTPVTILTERN